MHTLHVRENMQSDERAALCMSCYTASSGLLIRLPITLLFRIPPHEAYFSPVNEDGTMQFIQAQTDWSALTRTALTLFPGCHRRAATRRCSSKTASTLRWSRARLTYRKRRKSLVMSS